MKSAFIGTWKLNLSKSNFFGPAPLEWTDVFREIEGDQYEVTTAVVMADGSNLNERIVWPRQGGEGTLFLPGVSEGVTEVQTMISPNECFVTRMVDGKQEGSIHQIVSNDGKTLRYTLRIPGILEGEAVFDKQ